MVKKGNIVYIVHFWLIVVSVCVGPMKFKGKFLRLNPLIFVVLFFLYALAMFFCRSLARKGILTPALPPIHPSWLSYVQFILIFKHRGISTYSRIFPYPHKADLKSTQPGLTEYLYKSHSCIDKRPRHLNCNASDVVHTFTRSPCR